MPPKNSWSPTCTPFRDLILNALLAGCLSERPADLHAERVLISERFAQKVHLIMLDRRGRYGLGDRPLPSFNALRAQLVRFANDEKADAHRAFNNASGRPASSADSALSTPRAQRVRNFAADEEDDDSCDEAKPNPAALAAQDALIAKQARQQERDRKPDRAALDEALLNAGPRAARSTTKRPRKEDDGDESSADEAKPNPAALEADRAAAQRTAAERARAQELQAKQEARLRAAKKRKRGNTKDDAFLINTDDEDDTGTASKGGGQQQDTPDESSEYLIDAWDIKSELRSSDEELDIKQEG